MTIYVSHRYRDDSVNLAAQLKQGLYNSSLQVAGSTVLHTASGDFSSLSCHVKIVIKLTKSVLTRLVQENVLLSSRPCPAYGRRYINVG